MKSLILKLVVIAMLTIVNLTTFEGFVWQQIVLWIAVILVGFIPKDNR